MVYGEPNRGKNIDSAANVIKKEGGDNDCQTNNTKNWKQGWRQELQEISNK